MKEDGPILIAEDNDDDFFFFRRAAREALQNRRIVRFNDGAEFVKFAESLTEQPSDEPWLFFIDISMPIMTGFDVLQWLRDRPGRFNFRLIMLSGSDREEDIVKARTLGSHEYFVKPLSAADLARVAANSMRPVRASVLRA
jgi:CheY-like chemotaxis protein